MGYCAKKKDYKENPEKFKGMIADACGMIRVAVTGSKNSPDLYSIMQYMGKERFEGRVKAFIDFLEK